MSRVRCAVMFCEHSRATTSATAVEWLCAEHWRGVRKSWRMAFVRAQKTDQHDRARAMWRPMVNSATLAAAGNDGGEFVCIAE